MPRIKELSKDAETTWDRFNYLIALKNLDKSAMFLKNIFKEAENGGSSSFKQTYYSLVADLYSMTPSLSKIYGECSQNRQKGLLMFTEETRDNELFYSNYDKIISLVKKDDWMEILTLCADALENTGREDIRSEHLEKIKEGIVSLYRDKTSDILGSDIGVQLSFEDSLAVLFFTYQILTENSEN